MYVYVRAAVCVRARLCMYACVVVTVVGIMNVAVLIGCRRTQSSHIPVVVFLVDAGKHDCGCRPKQ